MPGTSRFGRLSTILCATGLLLGLTGQRSMAQDGVEPFYKGRTLTILAGSAPGGGYDAYARLLARYIGRYIPGTPATVVSNMPGAASVVLLNHLYNVAPQDGTQIGVVFAGALLEPLLGDSSRIKYDPLKLNYLGNANSDIFLCIARKDAEVQQFEDLFSKELVIGSSTEGGSTAEIPTLMNAILGTRYRIIKGYPGTREISLAIEKNEVQGVCGIGYAIMTLQYPDILSGNLFVHVFVQDAVRGKPELDRLAIATSSSFAKTAEQRAALDLYLSQSQFTRPFVLGPGVPAERLAVLRKAFEAAMRDPDLLAESRKINPELVWSTGEELAEVIRRVYATPAGAIERVRTALGK